eukprot:2457813-Amphidinium_carterae.1
MSCSPVFLSGAAGGLWASFTLNHRQLYHVRCPEPVYTFPCAQGQSLGGHRDEPGSDFHVMEPTSAFHSREAK